MNRIIVIGGIVACFALGGLWYLTGTGSAPGLDLPSSANAQSADIDTSIVEEMSIGNPDAPVTVIEYASYTCPHCARFHQGAFKDLQADYIDTGKINFVYREVYFDKFGLWAGLLARCGGTTDRYFAITDLLYENQSTWSRADNEGGIARNLMQLGRTAGFSDEQMQSCLHDQTMAQALVATYQKNATEHGIRSTPSFVINGELYSNMSYSEFQRVLAEAGAE